MRFASLLPLLLSLWGAAPGVAGTPPPLPSAPVEVPTPSRIQVPLFLGAFSLLFATGPERAVPAARVALAVGPALLLDLVVARWTPRPPEVAASPVGPADLGELGLRLADLLGIRVPAASLDLEAERRARRQARFR